MVFSERMRDQPSDLVLYMRPVIERMPLPMRFLDDPFFPFSKQIIQATNDLVCGYLFDFAAYMALGAAGAIALERASAVVGSESIKILHGPFASPDYQTMVYEDAFAMDAATLMNDKYLNAYLTNPNRGAFVVRYGPASEVGFRENAGFMWPDESLLTVPDESDGVVRGRIVGDDVLYAGQGEDFADACRFRLEMLR